MQWAITFLYLQLNVFCETVYFYTLIQDLSPDQKSKGLYYINKHAYIFYVAN
jgi:hypothetical protein